jgi:hypothetical protein
MGIRGELYSTKAHSEKRTFFFNVKENRTGDLFLNVVESVRDNEADFKRSQLMIYEEEIENFMRELQKAVLFLKKKREVSSKPNFVGGSGKAPTA